VQTVVVAVVVPLIAGGVAHLALVVAARRCGALADARGDGSGAAWLYRALQRSRGPLRLLIWVPAMLAALAAALPAAASPSTLAAVMPIVHAVAEVVGVSAVVWAVARVAGVIEALWRSLAARTANSWDDALLSLAGTAVRVLLPMSAVLIAVHVVGVPTAWQGVVRTGSSLAVIVAAAFLLYQSIDAVAELVLARYRVDTPDNLDARTIHTQVLVLKKIAAAIVAIFTVGSMLMAFEPVRRFGTSILASAGIAGIVVGLAAQRSIATLLAGLQIALTQPIRLDDVVIVDGEWGRIEDITLTYVTVRIWDERRLIVPITRFIEQPFENWTRRSAEILGTVFLYVDYRTPLEALRTEFQRILRESPSWDGKVNVLQVTDAREHTLEVRALASAADASLAWDLRCELREKLVGFLQREQPESLPRLRTELVGAPITTRVQ
jgi:small-conductance mechanosensitive channel